MTDAPTKLLIGGELRDAAAGATFTTFDPAHGGELATVAQAGTDDVDAAVTAARGALEGAWAKTSPAKRARALNRLAQLLDEQTDALAELESRNNGKAKWQCAAEMKVAVATLELFAGTAQHLYGRSHVVNPAVVTYTLREPVGVVGAIIPWNYPLMMAAWKVAPALATGNTMVLKPASATPLTALRLGELALEAGIPPGVLNVVPGPGAEVGEAIAAHPGIDKVAFTGETDTGRRIAAAGRDDPQARLAGARRQESRTSSSPTPTSTPPSSVRCGRSSTRPASRARRARGSSCRTRRTTRSHRPLRRRRAR